MDISMCANYLCPLRKRCYRYLAIPDEYQSYGDFKPEGKKCEAFWDAKNKRTETFLVAEERNINLCAKWRK